MYFATLLILFLLIKVQTLEVSIDEDTEVIEIFPKETKVGKEVAKHIVKFTKYSTPKTVKIKMYKIERSTSYCPATLNLVTSERCGMKIDYLLPPPELDKEVIRRDQCPMTKICQDDDCDGISKDECQRIIFDRWVNNKSYKLVGQTQIYWLHRCQHGYSCRIIEIEAYFKIADRETFTLENKIFGSCYFSEPESLRCISKNSWILTLLRPVEIVKTELSLPCLKGSNEEICWDDEEGDDFLTDENGNGRVDNNLYIRESEKFIAPIGEPQFESGYANSADLETVYRILQFENLQSKFNTIIMQHELDRTNRILYSVICNLFKVTNDPLHAYRGVGSKIIDSNKTHLLITASVSKNTSFVTKTLKVDQSTLETVLFPQSNLSLEETKRKKFRIESYDDETLFQMFDTIEKAQGSGTIIEIGWISTFSSFFNKIYPVLTEIVLWVNFVLNIVLVKIFFKRVRIS